MYKKYQDIGISHLFAISGMHIGLIIALLSLILKKLNTYGKSIIINIILLIYGFILGFSASIKRCILFYLLNSINKIFDLKISNIKILLLVSYILIILNYKIIFDTGFIFSIGIVMGILVSKDFINKKYKAIRLAIVAGLFSMPICLYFFYQYNLLSILYNIVFVSYVSLLYIVILITFIFSFMYPICLFMIKILEVTTNYLNNIKVFTIYLDFNLFELLIFYIINIFIFNRNKYKLSSINILIISIDFLMPFLDSNGYVYFFDIGQGDSSLYISPYRKDILLIDTGGKLNYNVSDNVISFLRSKGIKKIDEMIISHGDMDHIKDSLNIIKYIKVNSLVLNKGSYTKYELSIKKKLSEKEYKFKNMKVLTLKHNLYETENENCIVNYIKIYNTRFLTMGDAPSNLENEIINKYKLNVDIFKVSHHGSNTSSELGFLKKLNPKIAIISSGRNNIFKHPSKRTIDNLDFLKIPYFNTQDKGTIVFTISKDKVAYEFYKP